MTLKPDIKLRKVGDKFMLADVSDDNADITDVYTMNETAAFIWNSAAIYGTDPDVLAKLLCEEYDVDLRTAKNDVRALLDIWSRNGLLTD